MKMSSEKSLEICGNCGAWVPPKRIQNPGQAAPLLRVTSVTTTLGKCAVTGQACQRTDPACTSFRRG